jgi:hypothetical protein
LQSPFGSRQPKPNRPGSFLFDALFGVVLSLPVKMIPHFRKSKNQSSNAGKISKAIHR